MMIFLSLRIWVPAQAWPLGGLRGERRSKGANVVFTTGGNEVERTYRQQADAEGSLKTGRTSARFYSGSGGALSAGDARPAPTEPKARLGQPPTSERRVYTGALLAAICALICAKKYLSQ